MSNHVYMKNFGKFGFKLRPADATPFFSSDDGRVARASTSAAVDLGLVTSRVKPMTLKLVFTASLLDAQH